MLQKTIRGPVSRKGTGLHSGKESLIELLPAKENSGICFISKTGRVPALVPSVTGTQRGTSLGAFITVEHLLSAAYGLGITNLDVKLEGAEPPAFDGSALEYVRMIKEAGILEQEISAPFVEIKKEFRIEEEGASITAAPYEGLIIECGLDFPGSFVGKQSASFDALSDDFEKEIAPARTFGFLEEADRLREAGLALGASFDNAVVILKDGYSCPLRFPNELARHKILDIMGDMALSGKRIKGRIVSEKAGHRLNTKLAERILNA